MGGKEGETRKAGWGMGAWRQRGMGCGLGWGELGWRFYMRAGAVFGFWEYLNGKGGRLEQS